jgi:Bacterial Ig domain
MTNVERSLTKFMRSHSELFLRCLVLIVAVLALATITSAPALAQSSAPAIVGSIGYINGTPLTTHTSAAFNSNGASTLVAFVSSHPTWNGQPVSIGGLSDNLGNTWNVLTGPTTFAGSSFTLLSEIYYINAPLTSTAHTFTVNLTNPAPLVFQVFAVSGSDVTGPPVFSAITDPGAGGASASVTTAPITVPTDTLLLGWVKNETSATATAIDGYTLDSQSTSFLWAESQSPLAAGSYTGNFQYASAIGWQTAIVGLVPSTGPIAFNQTIMTDKNVPIGLTLTATSPLGSDLTYTVLTGPTHGTLSGSAPNLTYTPAAGYSGTDAFTFRANDGTSNSNTATVGIVVRGPAPVVASSIGYINGTPLTTHTSAAFNSNGASTLVAFVSSHPTWNGQPVSIGGLSDNLGNTWNVLTGPTTFAGSSFTLLSEIYYINAPLTSTAHTFTVNLTNPAPLVFQVFAVSGSDVTGPPIFSAITDPGAGGASPTVTTAPITVPTNSLLLSWVKNETSATATAIDGYTLDSQSTSFLWAESQSPLAAGSYTGDFQYSSAIGWQTAVVGIKPPNSVPAPVLTSTPASPTNQNNASFSFSDTDPSVNFLCQLDGGAFSACSSPAMYSGLGQGSHTFSVVAQDDMGNQSSATSFSWTIDLTPPPAPTITSQPANPTNQTSASFGFSDAEMGVNFLCQLDGSAFAACLSPATYSGLAQGSHTFAVAALDGLGNQSSATSYSWTIDTTTQSAPAVTSSVGYINSTPLTTHTSTSFNSNGASTLVAFVSSHPLWNGQPVSISGLSDNLGNTWNLLTGPTTFVGSMNTLLSEIYYINAPFTSTTHTFTVQLTNPAPLVFQVFAVTGSDVTGPPIFSTITDPGAGGASAVVTTASITVPTHSLLLSWVKNETSATATAIDGYTLDLQSTSFLWAETQSPLAAGSYTGDFQYDSAIGWQTALVGIKPSQPLTPPVLTSNPNNPTNQASATFSFNDSQTGVTFLCQLDGSAFSACSSPATYNGLSAGNHSFAVQAEDAVGNQSTATSFSWTIDLTPPPAPAITSKPANPTNQTSATFSFTDTEAGTTFLCQFDGSVFSACSSPAAYSGLGQGSHTFAVEAQDAAGNQSSISSFTWTIDTIAPPPPVISSTPNNPTNQTSANLSFNDTEVGSSFLCQLDGSALSACSNPATYSGLAQGSHTFAVVAQDTVGNQSSAASFSWTVDTTPPPAPAITSKPSNPTNQTSANFSFNDTEVASSFLCQLDGGAFSACSSPAAYSGLGQGSHTFAVEAQDAAGNQSAGSSFTWTIDTTAPPSPAITSTPANPTNQTGAVFSFSDTEAGTTLLCQLDGNVFSTCVSPLTYSGLSQGSHTFAVEAQDAAGNQSNVASFSWTIDTTPPPIPSIISKPNNPTNQSTAIFGFSDTEVGAIFLCQLDGSVFSVCVSPATYFGLSQGIHTFAVEAQDAAGNQSSPTSFSWTIDVTPPPPPIISSTPANPTSQTSATFSFSDTETGVSFLCQLDGGILSACSSPKKYTALAAGTHIFAVEAQDATGNQSGVSTFTWTIDNTAPPSPTITSTPANPTNQTSATFSFSDTEAGVTFGCQVDGKAFGACSSPKKYTGLAAGSHTFSVEARDAAGNLSGVSTFTWTIDTTAPPAPTINSAPSKPSSKSSASFGFSDTEAGVNFICQLDGSGFNSCSNPVAYSNLTDGKHTFSVKAQDAAGNQSPSMSYSWTVDTTLPVQPVITSTPANPTTLTSATFAFSDTETKLIFLCQLDLSTFTNCSSPKKYTGLSVGSHTFSVKAQDAAGNQSSAASFTWTITH